MTNWTRTDDGLEAVINGHDYLIVKRGATYFVYCDEIDIEDLPYYSIADAKAAAEAHAESLNDAPATPKPGVHIDNNARTTE